MALAHAGEIQQDKVQAVIAALETIGAKPNKVPGEGQLFFKNIHCTQALLERATEQKCALGQIVSQPPNNAVFTRHFTAEGREAGGLINALHEAKFTPVKEGDGVTYSVTGLRVPIFENGSPSKCTYELNASNSAE